MGITIRASVHIPLPPEAAWDLYCDAARFTQWQLGLYAVRDLEGAPGIVGSTWTLVVGPKLTRRVVVRVAERPGRHVLEQTGAGIADVTTATFEREGDGTRVTVVTVAHLNPVMGVLTRLFPGSVRKGAQQELDLLAGLATRRPPATMAGEAWLVESVRTRRRVTVLAVDADGTVHIRLAPGHHAASDPELAPLRPPKPIDAQVRIDPLLPPIRAGVAAQQEGLPFLARDGGQGVAHLALTPSAWADALPRRAGSDEVTAEDRAAVEAWRATGGPVVGRDADLELAPLCTLQLAPGVWTVAKVLKGEILKVHLAIPSQRWPERPAEVRPWELTAPPLTPEDLASGAFLDGRAVAVGHVPVSRGAFGEGSPRFAGVTTLASGELEGYRHWQREGGGTFTTLAILAGGLPGLPPPEG